MTGPTGQVSLVGAGPGDPELLTLKGRRRLEQADVLIYDRLVPAALLQLAPSGARRIDVGKRPGFQPWPQSRINRLLVAEARRGRRVVRLKGGDPYVFGRGGEEGDALSAARIRFEVIPGVTSAIAAPAAAGIPITHREHASAFAVISGHACGTEDDRNNWAALAWLPTLVVLMGARRVRQIAQQLMAHGKDPHTPVAIISEGTRSGQRVIRGTLDSLHRERFEIPVVTPATIVVGPVAALNATNTTRVDLAVTNSEQKQNRRIGGQC